MHMVAARTSSREVQAGSGAGPSCVLEAPSSADRLRSSATSRPPLLQGTMATRRIGVPVAGQAVGVVRETAVAALAACVGRRCGRYHRQPGVRTQEDAVCLELSLRLAM
jgi:hypothetical protein